MCVPCVMLVVKTCVCVYVCVEGTDLADFLPHHCEENVLREEWMKTTKSDSTV